MLIGSRGTTEFLDRNVWLIRYFFVALYGFANSKLSLDILAWYAAATKEESDIVGSRFVQLNQGIRQLLRCRYNGWRDDRCLPERYCQEECRL